jgi:multiple sugar transport system permease protein
MKTIAVQPLAPKTHAAQAPRLRPSLWQVAAHTTLLVMVLANLLPFVWMVLGSFKTYPDLANNPGLPNPWTTANYVEILSRANFAQALVNSVFVAAPRVLLACLTSAAVGYVFAKYRFVGRDILFTLLLSTTMVPFVVVLVPLYVTLADLGLVNNLGALIVVAIFSTVGTFI